MLSIIEQRNLETVIQYKVMTEIMLMLLLALCNVKT
jgi:hypothetical protein